MRPGRRLLVLALLAFAASAVAVALGVGSGVALPGAALAPLLVLAGLLATDLALSLRRPVGVMATVPAELFTGEQATVELTLDRTAAAEISCRLDWPRGLEGPADTGFVTDPATGIARAQLSVRACRRGAWRVRRLWLRWPSRLRLLEFMPSVALDLAVRVVPDVRPVLSGTIDVAVRSQLFGAKENVVRGEGSEFHQLRDFTAGMDMRSVDWKRSARTRRLLAKEMRAERNHHVVLAIDNGFLMREEIAGLPKIDHAINAALATAWAATLGGDLVGFYAFDSRPRQFLPPAPGRRAFARLRSQTAALDYESRETNHTLAMTHLHGRLQRRSLVVVFSDFVDTTTAELLVENVRMLGRRHVVIFVALRDPALERLATAAPRSLDDVAVAVSAGEMRRERRVVMERLARLGIVVVDVEPAAVTPRLVSTYLDLKAREVV